jgi:hypothetical protein
MHTPPPAMIPLRPFAPLLSKRRWTHVWVLLAGPLLRAAWYRKRAPTFADALAVVRRAIRAHETSRLSGDDIEMVKVPRMPIELTSGHDSDTA